MSARLVWVISLCYLSIWSRTLLIGSLLVGSGHAVASEVPPSPQPATPPSPISFDQSEDDPSVEPPLPATPPQPVNDKPAKITWPNQVPPFVPPVADPSINPPYDGIEYRFKKFVFRPAEYTLDMSMVLLLLVYTYFTYLGKRSNAQKVQDYWNSILPRLTTEFAQVGIDPGKPYVKTGPAKFLAYATGRQISCDSLSLKFSLKPRQDIATLLYQFLRSSIDFNWSGNNDRVDLIWNINSSGNRSSMGNSNENNGYVAKDLVVWALVEKNAMNELRRERWDVRTFTEVKELSVLPSNMVIMSESGDVTDQILKSKEVGLLELLRSQPDAFSWFDSLTISGTPSTEPTTAQLPGLSTPKTRTMTLRLRLPPHDRRPDHIALLNFAFTLLDFVHQISINSISAQKFVKHRAEWANQILSEMKKEEEKEREEERRKKSKEIQDQKVGKMSASEQKKFDEKERRRKAMKMNKTAMKRK